MNIRATLKTAGVWNGTLSLTESGEKAILVDNTKACTGNTITHVYTNKGKVELAMGDLKFEITFDNEPPQKS